MTFTDLLAPSNVLLSVSVASKDDLLRRLSSQVGSGIAPKDEILGQLLEREELGSTGVGHGIALPHAELAALSRPIAALFKLQQHIPFQSIDGAPIDLVFMLLFPDDDRKASLNVLSRAAYSMRDPAFRKRLAKIEDPAEVPSMMDEISLLAGTRHPAR